MQAHEDFPLTLTHCWSDPRNFLAEKRSQASSPAHASVLLHGFHRRVHAVARRCNGWCETLVDRVGTLVGKLPASRNFIRAPCYGAVLPLSTAAALGQLAFIINHAEDQVISWTRL